MEIETAARRFLLAHDGVRGYVGDKVTKFSLLEHVDGTGGRAIVVRRSNGWKTPDSVQTSEFPLLLVDCWADCDRVGGDKVADNAVDKAFAVYRVVDKLLHAKRDFMMGDLRIISSQRWSEPFFETANDAHKGVASLSTPKGDSAVVTAQYALHLVH